MLTPYQKERQRMHEKRARETKLRFTGQTARGKQEFPWFEHGEISGVKAVDGILQTRKGLAWFHYAESPEHEAFFAFKAFDPRMFLGEMRQEMMDIIHSELWQGLGSYNLAWHPISTPQGKELQQAYFRAKQFKRILAIRRSQIRSF